MEENAVKILKILLSAGFQAYFVGGCVRDRLMGRQVHDFDIAVSALPEEVAELFSNYTVVPTGLKHGTVTVVFDGMPFEITTFRIDGEYSDSRRPDKVCFTANIADDLSRRDFTMNALAMDAEGGIVDPFGGAEDIKNRIIRCVGEPEVRFGEDALRIMRGIRFASQLGFTVEKHTSSAIHSMKDRLNLISKERICTELDKLICGENCIEAMLEYSDVITEIIPEFSASVGFEQHSDYHCYNVWEHTVRAVASAGADDILLRRSLLFHDIAKPRCAKFDEQGKGHFKGHAEASAVMTAEIMKKLRYSNKAIEQTCTLIRHHSDKIRTRADVKRLLNSIGEELFFLLIEMKKCDNFGKRSFVLSENPAFDRLAELARDILDSGECYKLSQLEIKGGDLLSSGISGNEISRTLNELLDFVIEEKMANDREILLNYVNGR